MKRDPATLKDTGVDPASLSEDQKVRLSMRGKEYQQLKAANKDFNEEEEELKRFFQEGSKAVLKTEDPTVVRKRDSHLGKKKSEEQAQAYKDIANTINVKKFMSTFFSHEAPTPEEQEYLNLCRRVVVHNSEDI